MKLSVKLLLTLAGAISLIFEKHDFYGPDGNFIALNAQQVADAAVEIEQLLKANGLAVNAKVDHIIAIIPLLIATI